MGSLSDNKKYRRIYLLRKLEEARFHQELANEYGMPDLEREYIAEIASLELELKLLALRK